MSPTLYFVEEGAALARRYVPPPVTKPTNTNGLILEAWAQGFMVGALVIMACITIANMRRGVLLHKLILIEVGCCVSTRARALTDRERSLYSASGTAFSSSSKLQSTTGGYPSVPSSSTLPGPCIMSSHGSRTNLFSPAEYPLSILALCYLCNHIGFWKYTQTSPTFIMSMPYS